VRYLPGQVAKLFIGLQIIVSARCRLCGALLQRRALLAAENLFLRKQLALYREREKKPKPEPPPRIVRVIEVGPPFRLAQRVGDRQAGHSYWLASNDVPLSLALEVKTSWKTTNSVELRRLIRHIAAENPTWGEERIRMNSS
jgi:hypothetical protein